MAMTSVTQWVVPTFEQWCDLLAVEAGQEARHIELVDTEKGRSVGLVDHSATTENRLCVADIATITLNYMPRSRHSVEEFWHERTAGKLCDRSLSDFYAPFADVVKHLRAIAKRRASDYEGSTLGGSFASTWGAVQNALRAFTPFGGAAGELGQQIVQPYAPPVLETLPGDSAEFALMVATMLVDIMEAPLAREIRNWDRGLKADLNLLPHDVIRQSDRPQVQGESLQTAFDAFWKVQETWDALAVGKRSIDLLK